MSTGMTAVRAALAAACFATAQVMGTVACLAADAKGDIVVSTTDQAEIFGSLFEPVPPEQKTWAEQYDSHYLAEKPVPGIAKGSDVILLAEDSCEGRREYAFYPDGTVTVYMHLIGGPKGERTETNLIKMTPEAVAKLQSDLAGANFLMLSPNTVALKRRLADMRPEAAKVTLEGDGVTVSLKVVDPVSRQYREFHVYQFADLKKGYPMLKEYEVFEKCVQLIMACIPAEQRLKL